MAKGKQYVIVHCAAQAASTRYARLVQLHDGREVWIPFSVCLDGTFGAEATELEVQKWFAEKEDLI